MYGSYGSYSSMRFGSGLINIYTSVTPRDQSCAFPSWPRRYSLASHTDTDPVYEPRASSYLSDDDLFLSDDHSSSDSDDGRSSFSSTGTPPSTSSPTLGVVLASPSRHLQPPSEAEVLEMQRQRLNMRKDLIRLVQQEKDRRKQQAAVAAATSKHRRLGSRKSSSSNNSSSKNNNTSTTYTSNKKKRACNAMAPISEE